MDQNPYKAPGAAQPRYLVLALILAAVLFIITGGVVVSLSFQANRQREQRREIQKALSEWMVKQEEEDRKYEEAAAKKAGYRFRKKPPDS